MISLTISLLVICAVSAVAGWYANIQWGKPSPRELQALADLAKTKLELSNYQLEVNQYLETTADLFNNVSIQYKKLYDHLSTGSTRLSSVDGQTTQLEQLSNNSDFPELHPDHNWHPTYFEARDALKLEDTMGIKIKNDTKSDTIIDDAEKL